MQGHYCLAVLLVYLKKETKRRTHVEKEKSVSYVTCRIMRGCVGVKATCKQPFTSWKSQQSDTEL